MIPARPGEGKAAEWIKRNQSEEDAKGEGRRTRTEREETRINPSRRSRLDWRKKEEQEEQE